MDKKLLIGIGIAAVIIALLVGIYFIPVYKPTVPAKEQLVQRFSELETQYQEKKASGYDTTAVEGLEKQANWAYNKGKYAKADKLLDKAFISLKEARILLPSGLSPQVEEEYYRRNAWLEEKLVDWEPVEYKPMKFIGFHLPLSYHSDKTSLSEDIEFLDMFDELGVDVVSVGIPVDMPGALLEKLDTISVEVRGRGMELKIWYFALHDGRVGDEEKYNATKHIIERYHPDYYAILHEPKVEGSSAKKGLQEYVNKTCNLVKSIDPTVTTTVTLAPRHPDYANYFVEIPELDIIGFDLYGLEVLKEDTEEGREVVNTIELIHAHGKKIWIEEGWFSAQKTHTTSPQPIPGFECPNRTWFDAKWIEVITYYAQKHDIEAVEPFFTDKFILYPGYTTWKYDSSKYPPIQPIPQYLQDFKTALAEGRRTPTFYSFKEVIEEVKGGKIQIKPFPSPRDIEQIQVVYIL